MTVLFADLSGYTAASERMDPERVKALVDQALRRLGEEVERFGGTVDKYIGDNVMALFGAPVAHEDDAERAVRAGLGMQDAMGEINERLAVSHDATFELRVGINTGEVVAGAVGDAYTVVGDAVNVASRLQSAAQRGSVTVGERTVRATGQAIEFRELPPLTLKGKAEPVPAWEAIGVAALHPRRRATDARSPLVGRAHELDLLESLAQRVGARGPRPPGDRHRRGRGGQVAAAGRAPAPPGRRGPTGPRSSSEAARPTGRRSCTGRSARCCARSSRSTTATARRSPGTSSRRAPSSA